MEAFLGVVLWVFFAILVAIWAGKKRGAGVGLLFFFVALIVSPVIGALIVLLSPKSEAIRLREMETDERLKAEVEKRSEANKKTEGKRSSGLGKAIAATLVALVLAIWFIGRSGTVHDAPDTAAQSTRSEGNSRIATTDPECTFKWADASVTYMTPDQKPVVYKQELCGSRYVKTYYDLDGRVWDSAALVASSRHQLNEALEVITGRDLDINAEIDKQILEIAVERGIVPSEERKTQPLLK